MKKGLLAVILGGIVALGVAASKTATKYTCTLTGKTVEKCCCVEKDGKLYCTLANKTVDPCCCKPAD
jgi:hypothetical protein